MARQLTTDSRIHIDARSMHSQHEHRVKAKLPRLIRQVAAEDWLRKATAS